MGSIGLVSGGAGLSSSYSLSSSRLSSSSLNLVAAATSAASLEEKLLKRRRSGPPCRSLLKDSRSEKTSSASNGSYAWSRKEAQLFVPRVLGRLIRDGLCASINHKSPGCNGGY